jgi:hypothetical protein
MRNRVKRDAPGVEGRVEVAMQAVKLQDICIDDFDYDESL